MKLAITGATGNMGKAVMEQLCRLEEIEHIKLLSHFCYTLLKYKWS